MDTCGLKEKETAAWDRVTNGIFGTSLPSNPIEQQDALAHHQCKWMDHMSWIEITQFDTRRSLKRHAATDI
jgi:hypothetical protein